MDLSTRYLGFDLPHPFINGASPLSADLDAIRRLEDAGAAAIVMHSLFEEQIVSEQLRTHSAVDVPAESFGEAVSYLPSPEEFTLGPEEYLGQIRRIKQAVSVPVIASLNGVTAGGWIEYAKSMADAGADALELNVYDLTIDSDEDSAAVEKRTVDLVAQMKQTVSIPVAVKLSAFYTSMFTFAQQLDNAGADGLVMFNRLYQPDIDLENLELVRVSPVGRGDLQLRLRWLGILAGQIKASLAATGGVRDATDAVKALMAGADVVQLVSVLLQNGEQQLATIRQQLVEWMEENEYTSLAQLRGSMSLQRCPEPSAYQRANYMRTLLSWRL